MRVKYKPGTLSLDHFFSLLFAAFKSRFIVPEALRPLRYSFFSSKYMNIYYTVIKYLTLITSIMRWWCENHAGIAFCFGGICWGISELCSLIGFYPKLWNAEKIVLNGQSLLYSTRKSDRTGIKILVIYLFWVRLIVEFVRLQQLSSCINSQVCCGR